MSNTERIFYIEQKTEMRKMHVFRKEEHFVKKIVKEKSGKRSLGGLGKFSDP